MQRQEQEAIEGIKLEHQHPRTIGFEPVPVAKAAGSATRYRVTPGRLAAAVGKALAARALNADKLEFEGPPGTVADAVDRELGRRRQASKSGTGNEPVDLERMWRGGDDGSTLRKRAPEPTVPGDDGAALALVKMTHAVGGRAEGGAPGRPTGAIADARAEAGRLRELRKANPEWAPDARLHEAEAMAEALAAPVKRADLVAGTNPTPAEPYADSPQFTAAETGAAALLGGSNPHEVVAAVRANDLGWLRAIEEREVLAAVKVARTRPVRVSGPPRFRPS